MKILFNILKVIGVIVILVVGVSFLLPSEAHVERTITVKASPETVFALLNDFKKWGAWSPWEKIDTAMKKIYEGPETGVGSVYKWSSENSKVGKGMQTITVSKPNEQVETELKMEGMGTSIAGFKLEKAGDSTKITWYLDKNVKSSAFLARIPGRYFNLMMDGMIGKDFEAGLQAIKTEAETLEASAPATPKLSEEAAKYTVEEVDVAEMIVLVAPSKKMTENEVGPYLGTQFPGLYAEAGKNGLKPGMPAALYLTWDSTGTTVEPVVQVDKLPAKTGKYTARTQPATKALKVDYFGSYEKVGPAHEAINAYAAMNGKTITGAPWEVYVTDPGKEKDTAKWHTQIYYPVH